MVLRNLVAGKKNSKVKPKNRRGGNIQFGWTYLDGSFVIDPKEYLIVRKILKLHQSDKSNQHIADFLNTNKFALERGAMPLLWQC